MATSSPTKSNNVDTRVSSIIVEAAQQQSSPLRKMIAVASIATGIQFTWALQLSLLNPYVQLLGINRTVSVFIWLCGPISGIVVQPIVGYCSDRCTSRFGRRRPFILSGAILVVIAVFLIGYAADLGHSFGDDITKKTHPRAVTIFIIGFCILDVANNMFQGPCHAFLADLAAGDQSKTRTGNALFSFFMAVGYILGYVVGSYNGLHHIFPFSETKACNVSCANLKTCFIFSIILLLVLTITTLILVNDPQITNESHVYCFGQFLGALKELKKPMWMLMLVTAINWMVWFPYLLFDTDWMGREVYGGNTEDKSYDSGLHAGELGLVFNSVVFCLMSLAVEPLGRLLGGVKKLWGIVNFILAICMTMMVLISKVAEHDREVNPDGVKTEALILFVVLGIPLAVTYSVPFALASIYSAASGAGQGLSLGVLNLSIVIPQLVVSALSGPWDALFGGGNMPAFAVGAVAAAISAILAMVLLPTPKPPSVVANASSFTSGSFHL